MPELPFPPPPPPPPPGPPPVPPAPPAPPLPPAPPAPPPGPGEGRDELTTSLRRPPPPAWRRPLLLGGLSVAALLLGLLVGRSVFRAPEAPTFEPRPEKEVATPVEAAQETAIDIPVEPTTLPTGAGGEVDATDYGLLAKLQGDWEIELGGRGAVRVSFSREELTQLSQGGYQVRVYRCSSPQLPSRFTPVQVPDGGNFIAFHDDDGQTRDVFENIELHQRDLFSFTEAATGRRRYARRSGSSAGPPPGDSERPSGETSSPPESAPTWQEPTPSLPPADDQVDPGSSPSGDDEQEIDNLWKIATQQRATRQWGALVRTLDRLLEIDPNHRAARRWKNEAQQQLREQNREALGRASDLLDAFTSAIEDRDLDALRELWGGRLDSDTSQFFVQLFRRYSRLRVEAELISVTVDGKKATGFVANVTIEGKEKGRRAETEEYRWHGRLAGEALAGPFP